jgi:hypothetical protein
VWFARFEDSIENQEIKVAANSSRSQAEPLAENYRGGRAILEDGASDCLAGAHIVDFHNSIVS